jgi:hypothetical protein
LSLAQVSSFKDEKVVAKKNETKQIAVNKTANVEHK